MRIMFKGHIYEMAAPLPQHSDIDWYHGTTSEYLEGIMRDKALKPSEIVTVRTTRMMAPQHGRVYLTHNVEEALSYAYMRISSKNQGKILPILVVVDGKELKDFNPDEDTIADLVPKYITSEKFDNRWLRSLAMSKAPKALERYDRMGDYAYGTSLGKTLMKYLTDEQKYKLIEYGKKIAHEGPVQIKEIWQLPSEIEHVSITADEYEHVSKLLYKRDQE